MGLETSTYIDGLVTTNPIATDVMSKGDDHIRLIKATIQTSFPDVDAAVMTIHNGTSAPASKQTGTIWRDTTNSLWKFWNGSAWITLAIAFNTSNSVDVNAGTIDGVTIGGSAAPTVTNLGSVTTCDLNGGTLDGMTIGASVAPTVTNIDINGGTIDGVTAGTNSAITELQVDNINVNGNAITSTDSNGDLTITPNGTGEIILDGQKWPQADGSSTNYLTTNGSGQIAWTTNTVVTSENNAAASATTATAQAVIATAKAVLTAADVVSTNAAVVSCNAVLDTFDDRFLGSKSSVPTVDNDGATLTDGALYFNTTSNQMFVYDLGNTTWLQLTPTDSEQANINVVAGNILYQEDLGSIADSVSSGSGSDISTVADAIANVNTLAASAVVADMALLSESAVIADMALLAIPAVITDMDLLGATGVIADMALLAESAVITDMDLLGASGVIANIATVSTNVANVNLTGGSIANVNLTGASIANVNLTGGSITNVNTVATNIAGVTSFAEKYRVGSSNPASSLDEGDLFFNTSDNALKYYNGSSWSSITAGIGSVADDTSPTLGGTLDCGNENLTNCGTIDGTNLQMDFGSIA